METTEFVVTKLTSFKTKHFVHKDEKKYFRRNDMRCTFSECVIFKMEKSMNRSHLFFNVNPNFNFFFVLIIIKVETIHTLTIIRM